MTRRGSAAHPRSMDTVLLAATAALTLLTLALAVLGARWARAGRAGGGPAGAPEGAPLVAPRGTRYGGATRLAGPGHRLAA